MKLVWVTLLVIGMFMGNLNAVHASGFHLKSIGNAETGGRQISHWWYSSARPVFSGEALPGAEVIIDIDGKALSINADSSGNWNFQSQENLSEGDHQITLTSGESVVKFTLSTGTSNVNWDAVQKGGEETLPTVGTSWPTILLVITGVVGLGMGGKMIVNVAKE
jgi:hypothetical protein